MAKPWYDYSTTTVTLDTSNDDVLFRDVSDLADNATYGTVRRAPINYLLGLDGIQPGGRLTLESGVPISTSDQTAKGTLYYTPYVHDWVRLYDGTRPKLYTFTERSLSLTLTSGKNYDVFLYDNSGTLTLELSAAWTNDTTRADALAWQSGVGYVKSGTATRLWLGTIRASAANQTEDSEVKRFIWNAYNIVRRTVYVHDSTDSWSYSTASWRQKNGSTANQFACVCGSAGMSLADLTELALINTSTSTPRGAFVAIGYDSTTSPTGNIALSSHGSGYGNTTPTTRIVHATGLGYHYYAELEQGAGSDTQTFYGDAGDNTKYKYGMSGTYTC